MNYREAWLFLDNLQFFKIKLGLESMTRFLDGLGRPQKNLRFVHVAGTNGKGSVCITLLSILASAGYKVGLYTSPHLNSVRERFRINNSYISQKEFARTAGKIINILHGRQITYFEFTTAIAMVWFAEMKVDLAILEVGMGGRLDATNVICPLTSIITNVSMDHEAYLGNTLKAIATEKAGIIKTGVPVISGAADDASLEVIEKTCRQRKAPLYLMGRNFFKETEPDKSWTYRGIGNSGQVIKNLSCNLKGEYQVGNSAMALTGLEILGDSGFSINETGIRQGLNHVKWPGRLEYFNLPEASSDQDGKKMAPRRQYLIDGAHNPAGVMSLKKALETDFSFKNLVMVWASMADKDILKNLSIIVPICRNIILTRPKGERSAEPFALRKAVPEKYPDRVICIASVYEALDKARKLTTPDDLICIAGSLYLVGEARSVLLGEVTT
ncbi:MAG: folylpolyglutamate synthase/dihydrofolate synthase family protein, partial [Thermodesulfobacteriota bacterium]|nr:folylpolyglutamate synthase/dihydrofolate synthase family protein [Thermodesulfobacteriota bacterium]